MRRVVVNAERRIKPHLDLATRHGWPPASGTAPPQMDFLRAFCGNVSLCCLCADPLQHQEPWQEPEPMHLPPAAASPLPFDRTQCLGTWQVAYTSAHYAGPIGTATTASRKAAFRTNYTAVLTLRSDGLELLHSEIIAKDDATIRSTHQNIILYETDEPLYFHAGPAGAFLTMRTLQTLRILLYGHVPIATEPTGDNSHLPPYDYLVYTTPTTPVTVLVRDVAQTLGDENNRWLLYRLLQERGVTGLISTSVTEALRWPPAAAEQPAT